MINVHTSNVLFKQEKGKSVEEEKKMPNFLYNEKRHKHVHVQVPVNGAGTANTTTVLSRPNNSLRGTMLSTAIFEPCPTVVYHGCAFCN